MKSNQGYEGAGYGGFGYGGGGYGGSRYGTGYRGGNTGSSHYMPEQKMLLAEIKTQTLRYSYETLGNLLSTSEYFAGLVKWKIFKISYNYENLKSEFA